MCFPLTKTTCFCRCCSQTPLGPKALYEPCFHEWQPLGPTPPQDSNSHHLGLRKPSSRPGASPERHPSRRKPNLEECLQGQQTQQEAKQHQQATFRTIRPRLLESGKMVCTREQCHWRLQICMLHKRNLHLGPRRLLWRFGRALLQQVGVLNPFLIFRIAQGGVFATASRCNLRGLAGVRFRNLQLLR